jgi:XTP/dITP diphosphohydrolase
MTSTVRKLTPGTRLVVASHNKGKLVEIADLVRPFGMDCVSAGTLGVSEPEETEPTFAGNAQLKALHSARATGLPALSDDSGLEVHDLGGAPGIYSARWAGPTKDFTLAMQKVATELEQRHAWRAPGPVANFMCALCLAWPDGETQVFEGRVFGRLVWPARGARGFGYDPMFLADGETETYGEMDPVRKHATSHRARAFALFVEACLTR